MTRQRSSSAHNLFNVPFVSPTSPTLSPGSSTVVSPTPSMRRLMSLTNVSDLLRNLPTPDMTPPHTSPGRTLTPAELGPPINRTYTGSSASSDETNLSNNHSMAQRAAASLMDS